MGRQSLDRISAVSSHFGRLRAVKFPDAFIFEALKDLLEGQPSIHFIGADKGLNAAISQLERITIYPDIDSFVMSDVVQEQVHGDETQIRWSDILELIRDNFAIYYDELNGSMEYLLLDELPGRGIHHKQIPDDNGDAVIGGIYEPTNLSLNPEQITNFGPRIFNCSLYLSS